MGLMERISREDKQDKEVLESREDGVRENSYLMVSLYYVIQVSREPLKAEGQGLLSRGKGESGRDGDKDCKAPGGFALLKLETPKLCLSKISAL